MKKYLDIFFSFCRVGGLTFGGGLAMLPILEREVNDSHGWLTKEEIADYYALAQCAPGIIAISFYNAYVYASSSLILPQRTNDFIFSIIK